MYGNQMKRVDKIKAGDVLDDGAIIRCVLKTQLNEGKCKIVRVGGKKMQPLCVTPWHPVYDSDMNSWTFPANVGEVEEIDCKAVYSFLLEKSSTTTHIIRINDVPCICLGHGFNDTVLKHPFFGTRAVVDEMKRFPGFTEGIVVTTGTKRNENTGLVCGFIFGTSFYISDGEENEDDSFSEKEEEIIQESLPETITVPLPAVTVGGDSFSRLHGHRSVNGFETQPRSQTPSPPRMPGRYPQKTKEDYCTIM